MGCLILSLPASRLQGDTDSRERTLPGLPASCSHHGHLPGMGACAFSLSLLNSNVAGSQEALTCFLPGSPTARSCMAAYQEGFNDFTPEFYKYFR